MTFAMPAWITQEATIVALLAAIMPVLLAWLLDQLRAHRRRTVVTRALEVEVARIRAELGALDSVVIDLRHHEILESVPTVHPWMHSVIVEAAETSPAIVSAFLELDSRLAQLRRHVEHARAARLLRDEKHHAHAIAKARREGLEADALGFPLEKGESLHGLLQREKGLATDLALTNATMQADMQVLMQRRGEVLAQLDAVGAQLAGRDAPAIAPAREVTAGEPAQVAILERADPTRREA